MSAYVLEFQIVGLPKTPNSLLGAHWTVRAGHAKNWKRKVWRACWALKPPSPLSKAKLELTRESSAEPDFDGLAGSFKSVIDGLVETGILENDKPSNISANYFWRKGKRGHGKIIVKVESL